MNFCRLTNAGFVLFSFSLLSYSPKDFQQEKNSLFQLYLLPLLPTWSNVANHKCPIECKTPENTDLDSPCLGPPWIARGPASHRWKLSQT